MSNLSDLYIFQYGKGNTNPDNGGRFPIYGSNGIIGGYHEYNSEDAPVIGHIGANCGEVIWGHGKHYVTYNGIICKVKQNINKHFAYYTLLNSKLKDRIRGSAQPFISYDLLNEVVVRLPDIEEQKRIGNLLWSIDSKIRNNNAIISELEVLTRTIYDYWFLQFEFPNEEGKPYKSSGGKMVWNEELKREIPEGWAVEKFGNLIIESEKSKIQVGDVENRIGDIPFFTSGDDILRVNEAMVDGMNIYLNTGGNANAKFYNGKAAYSTDTWCIKGKDNLTNYIALYLLSIKEYLYTKFFHGTGLKHLQKPLLRNELILVPDKVKLENLNRVINPITQKIENCLTENYNLAKFRDYLLPLLMNGQVKLKSNDKKAES